MKKVLKTILFGLLFAFFFSLGIGTYASEDKIIGCVFFIICAIIVYRIYKLYQPPINKDFERLMITLYKNERQRRKQENMQNNTDFSSKKSGKQSFSIRSNNIVFSPTTVKQMLEAIYVVESTSKIDILLGNYSFIENVLLSYMKARSKPTYKRIVYEGVELYRKLYYDRVLSNSQYSILENPLFIDGGTFLGENIVRCFNDYIAEMELQIISLKTKSAKFRRYEKVTEVEYRCLTELKKIERTDFEIQIKEASEAFSKGYKDL